MSTNVPNLKQIGGDHCKNGQKFVDLMWNDPNVLLHVERFKIICLLCHLGGMAGSNFTWSTKIISDTGDPI